MFECACCNNSNSKSKSSRSSLSSSNSNLNSSKRSLACDDYPMIEVDEAIHLILINIQTLSSTLLSISSCSSSYISKDIVSNSPFPSFPTSMMDGYVVKAPLKIGSYQIQNKIFAGDEVTPFDISKISYITTGSQVPEGANAVVKVEDTEFISKEGIVSINVEVTPGENIRTIGSDISSGELIIPAGTKIGPAEIGLLATLGIVEVECFSKPIIGVMSTGDELVEPSEEPYGSKIRDSNRPSLLSAFRQEGYECIDLGIVKDTVEGLKENFINAVNRCDVVITSGGVSMGDADFVKKLLQELGTVHFGRLNMKPGKPTTFATVPKPSGGNCYFFGLPGNPVSCLVCKALVVDPALKRLQGVHSKDCMHPQVLVKTSQSYKLDSQRPEYHRVSLNFDSITQSFIAQSTGIQRSSRLLSMRSANALLCLPKGNNILPSGSLVTALLIDSLPSPLPDQCYHSTASRLDHFTEAELKAQSLKKNQNQNQSENKTGSGVMNETSNTITNHTKQEIFVGILTISDRAFQGIYSDESGPELIKQLKAMESDPSWPLIVSIKNKTIVPDEKDDIQRVITEWTEPSNGPLNLILTTGGTGFSPRDITPESIRPLFHREAPAIAQTLINEGLKHTPLAVLSRPVVGTRHQTLICTLPGSVKAIRENLTALKPLLPRIINLISSGQCGH